MTKPPQLTLALLGTAITVVAFHYARNIDAVVAAPPAAVYGAQTSDGGTPRARQGNTPPEVVIPERRSAMPVTSARPAVAPGATTEPIDQDVADAPETEATTFFGIPVPSWLDDMIGRRRSSVAGGTPVPSSETPATAMPATTSKAAGGAGGCKHTPGPHPQGVSAQVDFVGILLNGQQRESDTFSGAEIDDLKILVEWKSLSQNHAQRLDLIAPDGSLYQSFPRLVTVADNGTPVETRVPVNGTWITRYGLYGGWCVELFLDGEDAPVSGTRLVIAKPQ
jgi:hypothetical protein